MNNPPGILIRDYNYKGISIIFIDVSQQAEPLSLLVNAVFYATLENKVF